VINFIILACRVSLRLKWYKNYKNRLRLAKVIVKNKMSHFFMVHCVCVLLGRLINADKLSFFVFFFYLPTRLTAAAQRTAIKCIPEVRS